MNSISDLRNRVIEKVKLTKDEKDLAFLDDLLSKINSTEVYTYSSTEEKLLKLAEEDISSVELFLKRNWINKTKSGCSKEVPKVLQV
jgi:hypothetical protein